MLVCPACAQLYDATHSVCPKDSVLLEKPDDPRTGMKIGPYQIMGCLGQGGMGTVYRGQHLMIRKDVAIKVLHPWMLDEDQVAERFLLEARAASMLRHPNIVDVTDFGKLPDGCSFIVMEYLEGESLADEIARLQAIPLHRTVTILSQVAWALHTCHAKDIAHRDLKPENVLLVRQEGHRELVKLTSLLSGPPRALPEGSFDLVKVLDFGVAQVQQQTRALDQETERLELVFGSPHYLSPEQARGRAGDFRSDLYSLGVILFEMITGEVPFEGDSPHEILAQHVNDLPPSMCSLRPDLHIPLEAEALVAWAMAKAPEDRPHSALAFLKALRTCFGDVIYGEDIPRYLETQRTRTKLRWQQLPHQKTAPEPQTLEEQNALESLFKDKYEPLRPATRVPFESPDTPQPRPRRPLSELIRYELDGLFPEAASF